jgi:hypothetical protein
MTEVSGQIDTAKIISLGKNPRIQLKEGLVWPTTTAGLDEVKNSAGDRTQLPQVYSP